MHFEIFLLLFCLLRAEQAVVDRAIKQTQILLGSSFKIIYKSFKTSSLSSFEQMSTRKFVRENLKNIFNVIFDGKVVKCEMLQVGDKWNDFCS